jgi:hypothetical protein
MMTCRLFTTISLTLGNFISISLSIPVTTARIAGRDPYYISPVFKSLLDERNKLHRSGNHSAADHLASKINEIKAGSLRNRFVKLAEAPVQEMWRAINTAEDLSLETVTFYLMWRM